MPAKTVCFGQQIKEWVRRRCIILGQNFKKKYFGLTWPSTRTIRHNQQFCKQKESPFAIYGFAINSKYI